MKLKCNIALPEIVKVLGEPDPRAPAKQKIEGKETTVVREVVRVNHLRNCLLCHAPANVRGVPAEVITAPVPLPDHSVRTSGYGGGLSPDIFVRTDVTYLRQDFSLMMPVKDAKPWPDMQRFDFLVRTRTLTAEEAATYEKHLSQKPPPNHVAASFALRELTGHAPAESTPQAWRRLLKLPENGRMIHEIRR